MREERHLSVRVVPLLAVLVLAAAFFVVANTTIIEMATLNAKTMVYTALTWGFAALSVAGLLVARAAYRRKMHRWVRLHALTVAVARWAFCAYLARWGLIGLRFREF